MKTHTTLATGAALLALAVTPAVASAGPAVTVRVEGTSGTLLAPTKVRPSAGKVRRAGHSCSAASGAGALNLATRGRWNATWFSSLGFEVTKILGETAIYATTKTYWELFVNNRVASVGVCGLKLDKGDRLLFAAVPASGVLHPLGLTAPASATVGSAFTVKVVSYGSKGRPRPLAHAHVGSAVTNRHGIATITATKAGTLTLQAIDHGYIRSAPVKVHVSG